MQPFSEQRFQKIGILTLNNAWNKFHLAKNVSCTFAYIYSNLNLLEFAPCSSPVERRLRGGRRAATVGGAVEEEDAEGARGDE